MNQCGVIPRVKHTIPLLIASNFLMNTMRVDWEMQAVETAQYHKTNVVVCAVGVIPARTGSSQNRPIVVGRVPYLK